LLVCEMQRQHRHEVVRARRARCPRRRQPHRAVLVSRPRSRCAPRPRSTRCPPTSEDSERGDGGEGPRGRLGVCQEATR
jgi:hypothetical protein